RPWPAADRSDWDARWEVDAYPNDPAVRVQYLTRLLENSDELLAGFSQQQVGIGISFLYAGDPSHFYAVVHQGLRLSDRIRCVRAVGTVFASVYDKRCVPKLWADVARDDPAFVMNDSCYGFWYVAPLIPSPENVIDYACLDVMSRVVTLA